VNARVLGGIEVLFRTARLIDAVHERVAPRLPALCARGVGGQAAGRCAHETMVIECLAILRKNAMLAAGG